MMTLIAFLPVLVRLSADITEVPLLGSIPHPLVVAALLWSAFGTAFLALVGIKLPGLEFRNQRVEAAYRKELVYGEDDAGRAEPPTVRQLFSNVRRNYFRLYFHYMYFNVARIFYLQIDNVFGYVILAPAIVAGSITLGLMNQILNALGQVRIVVPVPRQLLDDGRRAPVDLQAPARLRGRDPRRAAAEDRPRLPRGARRRRRAGARRLSRRPVSA